MNAKEAISEVIKCQQRYGGFIDIGELDPAHIPAHITKEYEFKGNHMVLTDDCDFFSQLEPETVQNTNLEITFGQAYARVQCMSEIINKELVGPLEFTRFWQECQIVIFLMTLLATVIQDEQTDIADEIVEKVLEEIDTLHNTGGSISGVSILDYARTIAISVLKENTQVLDLLEKAP